MRVEQWQSGFRLVLSERNLKALLTKLQMGDSACTIFAESGVPGIGTIYVTSEDDATHYANREPPGVMHPTTETMIKEFKL